MADKGVAALLPVDTFCEAVRRPVGGSPRRGKPRRCPIGPLLRAMAAGGRPVACIDFGNAGLAAACKVNEVSKRRIGYLYSSPAFRAGK